MKKETLERANEIEKAIKILEHKIGEKNKILKQSNNFIEFGSYSLRCDYSESVFSQEEKANFQVTVKLFKEILLNQYEKAKERLEDELNSL